MDLSSKILIKRRNQGDVGPPNSLLNGELSFNEVDEVLYYGLGNDGNGNATNIISIAGGFTNMIKNAELYSPSTPLTESTDYLIVNINGIEKAIKLFDI